MTASECGGALLELLTAERFGEVTAIESERVRRPMPLPGPRGARSTLTPYDIHGPGWESCSICRV